MRTPSFLSSGATSPSGWTTSAASRCSGVTSCLADSPAAPAAAASASWLLMVSLSMRMALSPCLHVEA